MTEPLGVRVIPGSITYTAKDGKPVTFYFQCNPGSMSRSRTINRVDTSATNPVGTATGRGAAGRKFTHRATTWRLDSIELWFDASMPRWLSDSNIADDQSYATVVEAMQAVIKHLEAISEPGRYFSENESVTGAPPLPSPPLLLLQLGKRAWQGYVSSLTITEQEFTPDLQPRTIKASLSFDLVETVQQVEQDKTGGSK